MAGLYSSLYGNPQQGLFESAYTKDGVVQISRSSDIRLGDTDSPWYLQKVQGIPVWIVGVAVLGFLIGRE